MKKKLTAIIGALVLVNAYLVYYLLTLDSEQEIINESNNKPLVLEPTPPLIQGETANISLIINHYTSVFLKERYYNDSALELIKFTDSNNVVEAFVEKNYYADVDHEEVVATGLLIVLKLSYENPYANGFIGLCEGELNDQLFKETVIRSCIGESFVSSSMIKDSTLYAIRYQNITLIDLPLNQLKSIIEFIDSGADYSSYAIDTTSGPTPYD